jgi:hypothetical protein
MKKKKLIKYAVKSFANQIDLKNPCNLTFSQSTSPACRHKIAPVNNIHFLSDRRSSGYEERIANQLLRN